MGRNQTELSPRGAIMLGLLLAACGAAAILGALDIIPYPLTKGTPVWVGLAAGALFILAGAAMVNGYVFGGGKDFDTKASPLVYTTQQLLGFSICALFAAIGGWIALGAGERNFSMSISLPFVEQGGRGGDGLGRAMFGLGALMCAAMAMYALVAAFRGRR